MKKFIGIVLVFILCGNIKGQSKWPDYSIEASALINFSDSTPFWLFNNQYAKYSLPNSSSLLDIKLENKIDTSMFFDYSYGMEMYALYDGNLRPVLHQCYGKIKIWEFIIQGGLFEDYINYSDTALSMGHILWSKNIKPLPKISFSSNGYYTVPYTYKMLQIKATFTHGWFNDDRYVNKLFLHHKNLYVKLGGNLPVNVFGGLEHFAQWGGVSPNPDYGKLPTDFDSYLRVVKGEGGDSTKVNINEVIHRLGNHIGSWNIGIETKSKFVNSQLYWQSIFDDNSGRSLKNFPDGLWGLSLSSSCFPAISGIVYEYLHTTDQSGPIHDPPHNLVGNDNYFNHYIYLNGWTYNKLTIGVPFITSSIYNSDSIYTILRNTRVIVHHFGIKGILKNIRYRTLLSIESNYGTHPNPFNPVKNQTSMLIEMSMPLKSVYGIVFSSSVGIDFGSMYGNNFGILIKLSKSGVVFK